MQYNIKNFYGSQVTVEPSVQLYSVRDFMGKELLGLAIELNEIDSDGVKTPYTMLTTSFGEFISIKNAAYIDTNNCEFADQLLQQGIAEPTGLTKTSGFWQYPLWIFSEDFLKEHGGETYQKYSEKFDSYMNQGDEDIDETCEEGFQMTM